jgi:ApaG protein
MPELKWDYAPISDALTHEVRVEVLSRHATENSRPSQGEWVFEYTVRITNQGLEPVQLLSRHWVITDGFDHVEEVRGPGVVGKQPLLRPGESFKYSSWYSLRTPTGVMYGTYQMAQPNGKRFEIEIAPFALKASNMVH